MKGLHNVHEKRELKPKLMLPQSFVMICVFHELSRDGLSIYKTKLIILSTQTFSSWPFHLPYHQNTTIIPQISDKCLQSLSPRL